MLRNFYFHFCLLRYIWTRLKKGLGFLLGMKSASRVECYVTFKSIFLVWDILEHDLKKDWNFCLVSKLHQAGEIMNLLNPFLPSETFRNVTLKSTKISSRYENDVNRTILRNFWVHFHMLRYSITWLKKGVKVLVGMKTTSSGGYYVTFEYIFASWDILEHDLKKGWNFCLLSKTHHAGDIS